MEKSLIEIKNELGISEETLRAAIKRGDIAARKTGAVWLVDTENQSFKKWLSNRPAPGRGRPAKSK